MLQNAFGLKSRGEYIKFKYDTASGGLPLPPRRIYCALKDCWWLQYTMILSLSVQCCAVVCYLWCCASQQSQSRLGFRLWICAYSYLFKVDWKQIDCWLCCHMMMCCQLWLFCTLFYYTFYMIIFYSLFFLFCILFIIGFCLYIFYIVFLVNVNYEKIFLLVLDCIIVCFCSLFYTYFSFICYFLPSF